MSKFNVNEKVFTKIPDHTLTVEETLAECRKVTETGTHTLYVAEVTNYRFRGCLSAGTYDIRFENGAERHFLKAGDLIKMTAAEKLEQQKIEQAQLERKLSNNYA